MQYASQWRLDIARRIAPIIARNPDVRAVMVGGSTSRDRADSYSDIEIGVFWSCPPRDEERLAPIEPAGGVFWELDPYNPDAEHWMDEWGLNNLKIDMRNMTLDGVERLLHATLDEYDTALFRQHTLSAIQHGLPLYGDEIIRSWQERLAHYPIGLSEAMVQRYIREELHEWCWWVDQLLSRKDIPLVYKSFGDAIFQVINILMGLNRIYHPGFKWLHHSLAEMAIQPDRLGERINAVYAHAPHDSKLIIRAFVLETYDLAAQILPSLNDEIQQARAKFLHQRPQFEQSPQKD